MVTSFVCYLLMPVVLLYCDGYSRCEVEKSKVDFSLLVVLSNAYDLYGRCLVETLIVMAEVHRDFIPSVCPGKCWSSTFG